MPKIKIVEKPCPVPSSSTEDALTEVIREGARKMLAAALAVEVEEYIERFSGNRDCDGRRRVVRNGFMPARTILTGVGPLEARRPRVQNRGRRGCRQRR